MQFGPWMLGAMRRLAKLRRLRGTAWDIFRFGAERRLSARLLADYEADVALILERLCAANLKTATELAALPEHIRGYGAVRERSAALAAVQRTRLRERLGAGQG